MFNHIELELRKEKGKKCKHSQMRPNSLFCFFVYERDDPENFTIINKNGELHLCINCIEIKEINKQNHRLYQACLTVYFRLPHLIDMLCRLNYMLFSIKACICCTSIARITAYDF